jgi:hypothetical protein
MEQQNKSSKAPEIIGAGIAFKNFTAVSQQRSTLAS